MNNYRERSTAEIEDEQKELNRLRFLSQQQSRAWWEWDGDRFIVSPEWEALTGYKAADVFPQAVSPQIGIEKLIPALIEKWASFVHPDDREAAESALNDFLLLNNSSATFEHGYRFVCADGTEKLFLSTACSVWENGRLTGLVAQSRDIGQWTHKREAAKEIAKHTEQIGVQKTQIKELKVSNKKSEAAIASFKKSLPALFGLMTAIVTAGEPLIDQLAKIRRRLTDTPNVVKIQPVESELFLSDMSGDTFNQLEELVKGLAREAEVVEVALYDPPYLGEPFPTRYRVFMRSSFGKVEKVLGEISDVNASGNTASRASIHTIGQLYTYLEDGAYHTSKPFSVPDGDGRNRLFYVQIETKLLPTQRQKDALKIVAKESDAVLTESALLELRK